MHRVFTVPTQGPGLYEITDALQHWLRDGPVRNGVLTVFIRHTSASLLIQENADPSVRDDLNVFLARLAPRADDPSMAWITHRSEGPDDMPAHIRAALLPTSLQVPVIDRQMALGQWQGVYVVEHRDRPQRRQVIGALHGID